MFRRLFCSIRFSEKARQIGMDVPFLDIMSVWSRAITKQELFNSTQSDIKSNFRHIQVEVHRYDFRAHVSLKRSS